MNLIQAYGQSIAPSVVLLDRGIRNRGMALPIPTGGGAGDPTRSACTGSAS
ncbi:hypothetical protein GCM10027067_30840 [Pseudactinotalea suaedae]|jgi:hypothetical protein